MEKREAEDSIRSVTTYFRNLHLNPNSGISKSTNKSHATAPQPFKFSSLVKREWPPSLVSLCIGVVGRHLEDIADDLAEIASTFPSDIKMALVAIARRRKLLNDDIIIALADSSWEILDLSGSDVSDIGLCHVVKICRSLRAVDIRRCSRLTSTSVSELLQYCHSLEILKWGGCPSSHYTARRCSSLLKPSFSDVGGESWEELDVTEFTHGARSLRWLVWPKIDKDSLESLLAECPRIIVNPKPSPLGFRGSEVPQEAIPEIVLDEHIVEDIDPETWATTGFTPRTMLPPVSSPNELSIAEKFRLAFMERDARLAPKRAKNARQHQRRAERERVMTDARAKALALASKASKSLHPRNS